MDVTGRTAVVTGAAGGIGAALAAELLNRGARVLISDLDAGRLEATHTDLAERHGEDAVAARSGDAADEHTIRGWIEDAERQFGPVGLYFANAGVGSGGGLEAGEDQWRLGLEVNVMAHVRAARLLVPRWIECGEGHFVVTASAAGLLTQIGSAVYAVSKHAAVAFAEWLAVTYGKQVGVTCLCPMGVDTAMLQADSSNDLERAAQAAVIEAGGVLSPAQVAHMTIDAVEARQFLVLPHPEVREFAGRRASDHQRWISGMQRYADSLTAASTVTSTSASTVMTGDAEAIPAHRTEPSTPPIAPTATSAQAAPHPTPEETR